MSKTKTGLGRGLDALINPNYNRGINSPITIATSEVKRDDGKSLDFLAKIDLMKIVPNPFQPRTEFDPTTLGELRKSILENGLIQPITVRRGKDGNYELISGERRFRACKDIGLREIPAYIIKVDTKEAMVALSLIENIQREELNPIEIAHAYKRLLEECNLSHEEIAKRVGKDRSTVTNSIRLLKLPEAVQNSLIKNEISAGHARALINLQNDKMQIEILRKIIKDQLSVRKVEQIIQKINSIKEQKKASKPNSKLDAISNTDIENKLRGIFGTKVMCKQKKDGAGEILIEFYSNDELERLFELFEIIEEFNT
ncbi:MAG: ParB/RepB/Spo0J family partition protein [Bacteroidetes bacterium]|nr:ParB/RepB/Spo0J family partition protein [Bacteroidota bacterium]